MKPIANSQAMPSHANAMPSGARGGVNRAALKAVPAAEPTSFPQPPVSTHASDRATAAWAATLPALEASLFPAALLWVSRLHCAGESNGLLVLTGSVWAVAWVRRRYGAVIGNTVRERSGFTGCLICEETK